MGRIGESELIEKMNTLRFTDDVISKISTSIVLVFQQVGVTINLYKTKTMHSKWSIAGSVIIKNINVEKVRE